MGQGDVNLVDVKFNILVRTSHHGRVVHASRKFAQVIFRAKTTRHCVKVENDDSVGCLKTYTI